MRRALNIKLKKLGEICRSMGKVAVAYSGGVDSTFLLRWARDTLGPENVLAVTALSPLYPERERRGAEALASEMGVKHLLIESNELEIEGFVENPVDRCYLCKRELFEKVKRRAREEGILHVVEGSTLDDEADHRPGKRALRELDVRSPLLEASFTKAEVREVSRSLGLKTWDKPSFACLASRFPYGKRITEEGLKRVGEAEDFLIGLGFKQVRVRDYGDLARIEVYRGEIGRLLKETVRDRVVDHLKSLGYRYVTLDLQGFRSGSMNEVLR